MSGAGIYPLELLIPVVVLGVAVGARLFYGGTMLGRALRATAFDREASLAVGIDVNRMVGLSYALSSMLAAVGGVLIGPLIGVSSHMGFLIGLKAFAVAIVGGLEHPVGILVASARLRRAGESRRRLLRLVGQGDLRLHAWSSSCCSCVPTGLFGRTTLRRV